MRRRCSVTLMKHLTLLLSMPWTCYLLSHSRRIRVLLDFSFADCQMEIWVFSVFWDIVSLMFNYRQNHLPFLNFRERLANQHTPVLSVAFVLLGVAFTELVVDLASGFFGYLNILCSMAYRCREWSRGYETNGGDTGEGKMIPCGSRKSGKNTWDGLLMSKTSRENVRMSSTPRRLHPSSSLPAHFERI
jgi:hypothetical protein